MASTVFPVASTASATTPDTVVGVPYGLTLRNTYTSTTGSLSYPVNQVYVVAVGGGAAGVTGSTSNGAANGGGGGGGAGGGTGDGSTAGVGGAGGSGCVLIYY